MRVLATADVHYNHPKSRALADDLIDRMNAAGGDVVLFVGDTAVADGDALERCLARVKCPVRLFVPGNHELWTAGDDSRHLLTDDLPRRVTAAGWHWLPGNPWTPANLAIVGSLGWYDYSFASPDLGIPRRFYERKISPGSAQFHVEHAHLLAQRDDIGPQAMQVFARWNDGRFVKLGMSDERFLDEQLNLLRQDLAEVAGAAQVLAAVHHLPFGQLLPPRRYSQWDFARAFLGSPRIGQLLSEHTDLTHVLCGHSHWPAEATIGPIRVINIGSGYRWKTYLSLDLA